MTRDMKIPVKVVIIMTKLVTNSNIDEKNNDIPRQNNGHPQNKSDTLWWGASSQMPNIT